MDQDVRLYRYIDALAQNYIAVLGHPARGRTCCRRCLNIYTRARTVAAIILVELTHAGPAAGIG